MAVSSDSSSPLRDVSLDDLTVLHVDDSAADRYRRGRLLQQAGFAVIEAGSALEALEAMAGRHLPDIVLLDVRLPDASGLDLAREIKQRAQQLSRDLGVVLLSAYFTDPEFRVRGLDSGADAYLIEPLADAELIATLRAVSRRLRTVRRLREQERLLDALFEYIPEGITVADARDGRIRRVSRYGMRLLGGDPAAIEGTPLGAAGRSWEVFHADGVTPARTEELPLLRASTVGAIIENEEWVLRRADGARMVLLCNAGPIRDDAGRVTGGVIAWRDISPRKQSERELAAQADQLREADLAKNEFLAGMAHEMRQPLHAAMSAIGVMKARLDRMAGERARTVIERQLQQLNRMTTDLLDATHIVRREVTLHRQPIDLREVVERAIETVRPAVTDRQHELSVAVGRDAIVVEGDSGRLEQVFVNVLSNAAKYTPGRGRIDVQIERERGEAVVRITDSGDGIPADQIDRIFELFTRASSREAGFGMGLAVARTLVALHGGSIEARSEGRGRGSQFVIRLPVAAGV